jgi:hypothetical protein
MICSVDEQIGVAGEGQQPPAKPLEGTQGLSALWTPALASGNRPKSAAAELVQNISQRRARVGRGEARRGEAARKWPRSGQAGRGSWLAFDNVHYV